MELSIFSNKEQYLLEHDIDGNLNVKPNNKNEIIDFFNLHYKEGMTFTQENGFPILKPYLDDGNWEFVSYSHRRSRNGQGCALHCFENDYCFNSIWTHLDKSVYELKDYDVVFTPDFSLFVDVPDVVNKWSTFKTRFVGAFMQQRGYNVIPTVSWGNAGSLNYSLEGLPIGSILGTCGTGIRHCSAATKLWQYGMRRVEEQLRPKLIYVYGEPIDIPCFKTEIKYIPTVISKFYRK